MKDKYRNFRELELDNELGEDYLIYNVDRGADIAIITIHGGHIEPGTSEITMALAGKDFNYYCFESCKPRGKGENFHIKSTNFDEPECVKLVMQSDVVISIHGKKGNGDGIFMGGLDLELKNKILNALNSAGFDASHETNSHLMAKSSSNICNKGTSGNGVQLEILRGLRNNLKNDAGQMNTFCEAIRLALAV